MTTRMHKDTWPWFAGLFEGEGCITFTGVNSVCISVSMTDEDIIMRLLAKASVGSVYVVDREGCKRMWRWVVADAPSVGLVLTKIMPYLGDRRFDKAAEALERLARVRKKGLCSRGHKMSGTNVYTTPKGQRMCRACVPIREAARRR